MEKQSIPILAVPIHKHIIDEDSLVTEMQTINIGDMANYLIGKDLTPGQVKKAIALFEENINMAIERRQLVMDEYKTTSTDTLIGMVKNKLSIIQNTQLNSFPNESVRAWVIIEQVCKEDSRDRQASIYTIIDVLCSRGIFTRREDIEADSIPYKIYVSESEYIASELDGASKLVLMVNTYCSK